MATLISTGAVNLTSSTNWSPAQIPAPGDDLVIGAATLTLDADFEGVNALGSITFNNASAKLAFSGASRTVDFMNGLTVAASGISLFATAPASGDFTLRGTWKRSGDLNNAMSSMVASAGANITLATIGDDPGAVLIEGYAGFTGIQIITSSWTGGTLTTIGRFDLSSWTAGSTLVTMSCGEWNHTNTGTSLLGAGAHIVFSASGSMTLNWSGDLQSASTVGSGLFVANSGTSTFNFNDDCVIKRTASNTTSTFQTGSISGIIRTTASSGTTVINVDGTLCVSNTGRCVSFDLTANTRLNWRNQARSIPSTDAVIIFVGTSVTVDLTDLQISNAGRFMYMELASAQAVVDSSTLITNTTTSAQACVVSNSGALDGKVINLASDAPTLPAVEDVAGGTVYGYTASPLTGTGVISDPAVIAAAVGTALAAYDTNGVASRDDLDAINVDLQPVLDKLPTSERAAGNSTVVAIKAKTDNLPSDPADQSAVESAITNASNAITSLINALNDISAADVNAEILDVLQTDTFSELTEPPAANSSLKDKITYLFMWAKNKATQTSSERKLYADDGTTVVSTELVSDDNTTFIKNKAQ